MFYTSNPVVASLTLYGRGRKRSRRDVPPRTVVAGIPAQVVREL